MFVGSCIIIYVRSKTNQMHNISNFILEQHSTCFGQRDRPKHVEHCSKIK
jgi:hypothetical protein